MEENEQDTMKKYAEFADGSYSMTDMSHHGYEIDPELSNRNRVLYFNPQTKHAIYSFRGSDFKGKSKFGDLGTDALLAIGLKTVSARFKNASTFTRKAIDKYGKDNLTLTGHSLGGSQALYAHSKHGLKTHVFNPGVSPDMAKEGIEKTAFDKLSYQLFKKPIKNNATIYTTGKDIISILSPFVSNSTMRIVSKKKGINAHSLRHFMSSHKNKQK